MNADFIDSNIFVYLFDETDARKRTVAEELIRTAIESQQGIISFQVVQETLNVLMHKIASPLHTDDARRFLDSVLLPLCRVFPSPDLYRWALGIHGRYQYRFYDSLIIAAALDARCARLQSEDLQHNQRIETLVIRNPFLR